MKDQIRGGLSRRSVHVLRLHHRLPRETSSPRFGETDSGRAPIHLCLLSVTASSRTTASPKSMVSNAAIIRFRWARAGIFGACALRSMSAVERLGHLRKGLVQCEAPLSGAAFTSPTASVVVYTLLILPPATGRIRSGYFGIKLSTTRSRLKLAAFARGGNSLKLSIHLPTSA